MRGTRTRGLRKSSRRCHRHHNRPASPGPAAIRLCRIVYQRGSLNGGPAVLRGVWGFHRVPGERARARAALGLVPRRCHRGSHGAPRRGAVRLPVGGGLRPALLLTAGAAPLGLPRRRRRRCRPRSRSPPARRRGGDDGDVFGVHRVSLLALRNPSFSRRIFQSPLLAGARREHAPRCDQSSRPVRSRVARPRAPARARSIDCLSPVALAAARGSEGITGGVALGSGASRGSASRVNFPHQSDENVLFWCASLTIQALRDRVARHEHRFAQQCLGFFEAAEIEPW